MSDGERFVREAGSTGIGTALVLLIACGEAQAQVSVDTGVHLGSLKISSTAGRAAIVPSLSVRFDREPVLLSVRDEATIVGAIGSGAWGFSNALSVLIGYTRGDASASAGATLAGYWFADLCSAVRCGPVVGLAPGASAHVDWFFKRVWMFDVGVQGGAQISWYGGKSLVLPGGPSIMVMAGPIFRIGKVTK